LTALALETRPVEPAEAESLALTGTPEEEEPCDETPRAPLDRLETIAYSLPGAQGADLIAHLAECVRLIQSVVRQLSAVADACPERLELEPILLSVRYIGL